MSHFGYRLLLLVCLLPGFSILNGCGGKKVESVNVESNSAVDDIKTGLNELVESGEVTSSIEDIRLSIGKLGEDKSALIDELMKDLDELTNMTDKDKVKAKAKEMIEKVK